jgi:hypothetical protein
MINPDGVFSRMRNGDTGRIFQISGEIILMYLWFVEIQSVHIISCCPGLCRGMAGNAGE